jgi:hypothetical protein
VQVITFLAFLSLSVSLSLIIMSLCWSLLSVFNFVLQLLISFGCLLNHVEALVLYPVPPVEGLVAGRLPSLPQQPMLVEWVPRFIPHAEFVVSLLNYYYMIALEFLSLEHKEVSPPLSLHSQGFSSSSSSSRSFLYQSARSSFLRGSVTGVVGRVSRHFWSAVA